MKKILSLCLSMLLIFSFITISTAGTASDTSSNFITDKNMDNFVQNQIIDKQRIDMEAKINFETKQYAWADQIVIDLMEGKIDKPPGATIVEGNLGAAPGCPTIISKRADDLTSDYNNIITLGPPYDPIAPGYQVFGHPNIPFFPTYCAKISGRTSSLMNLLDSQPYGRAVEYHVLHQYGRYASGGSTQLENAIVIWRYGSNATFQIFMDTRSPQQVASRNFPANHVFEIGINPQNTPGYRGYNNINYWVWDLTTNEYWSYTAYVPQTQKVADVDNALELVNGCPGNGLWKCLYNTRSWNEYGSQLNLYNEFSWQEGSNSHANNVHDQVYFNDNGVTNGKASLWQMKTPL